MSSGTFVAFSKFHLNTSKSPNTKVVQFVEGHNFHVDCLFKFWVEKDEKLVSISCSLKLSDIQSLAEICAKSVEKNTLEPLQKL
jgi:hypothetical protein